MQIDHLVLDPAPWNSLLLLHIPFVDCHTFLHPIFLLLHCIRTDWLPNDAIVNSKTSANLSFDDIMLQGSAQDGLNSGWALAETLSSRINIAFQHYYSLWVAVKIAWVVVKVAEWWLGSTIPDQCGQNPDVVRPQLLFSLSLDQFQCW